MNYFAAWFVFARRVWLSLGLGWAAPIAALTPVIRLDQAGAILVCAAIVGEVLHEKRHRLFVHQIEPGLKSWHIYREVDVPGENRKDIEATPHQNHTGKTTVNTSSWPLYHLARPEEFYLNGHTRNWDLERTMKRLERKVDYAIVSTAIGGTIFWAFA